MNIKETAPFLTFLTKREMQVFELIGEGLKNTEIGAKLYLSPKSTSTYRRRILDKLGLENNAGIIKLIALMERDKQVCSCIPLAPREGPYCNLCGKRILEVEIRP